MGDSFTTDYENLKTEMEKLGLSVSSSNLTKFSVSKNGVSLSVAAHIATQKPLFQIGSPLNFDEFEMKDEIYQYQVWVAKGEITLATISGGGKGNLDVSSISSAVSELKGAYFTA